MGHSGGSSEGQNFDRNEDKKKLPMRFLRGIRVPLTMGLEAIVLYSGKKKKRKKKKEKKRIKKTPKLVSFPCLDNLACL